MARLTVPRDEKWFQLGVLISGSFSLVAIVIGKQLAMQYGAGVAIGSILVGNLILWLIGMSVIAMALQERSNAVDNVKCYLGDSGALFMVVILIVSVLNWFAHQIAGSVPTIGGYLGRETNADLVRLGAGIGLLVTLLSIGGLRWIQSMVFATFPFVLIYYVVSIFRSDFSLFQIKDFGLSLSAIVSTVLIFLPGVINLPTVFRYARSKEDCFLGLTVLMLLISFFQIATIWMPISETWNMIYTDSKFSPFSIATFLFVLLTLVYMNLLNIYFASACWETYVPRFEGPKGYAVIGLMGTAAYTFLQVQTPIYFIAEFTNCYLASLGVVLLIGYFIRIVVKHRPRRFEKETNGFCWAIGCLVSTICIIERPQDSNFPLLMGVLTSAGSFLGIIFLEETIWSIRKIFFRL